MSSSDVDVPAGFGCPATVPASAPATRPAITRPPRIGPPPTAPDTFPAIPAICAPRLMPSTPQPWHPARLYAQHTTDWPPVVDDGHRSFRRLRLGRLHGVARLAAGARTRGVAHRHA